MTSLSPAIKYPLAAAYLYGTAVHLANIAGLSGFDWGAAPLRWQALDLLYLALDVTVVVGLFVAVRVGLAAFAIAAIGQILLYTVLRDWVLDVPPAFAPTPEQRAWLDALVAFHIASIALVSLDVARRRVRAGAVLVPPLSVCLVTLLPTGCGGGGGGGVSGPSAAGSGGGGERSPFADDPPAIDPRYVAVFDTRPTVEAVAAGVDPDEALVPDTFECHDKSDADTSSADLLVTIDGTGGYVTALGAGRVEPSTSTLADVRFRGGPFDGSDVRLGFDAFGQSFDARRGRREYACYQSGASAARASTRFRLDTPEPADYDCRDVESGASSTLSLGADGRYAIGGRGGDFGVIDLVEGDGSTIVFEGGPLDGWRSRYRGEAESGYRRFDVSVVASDVFPGGAGGSGELALVCERIVTPVFLPEYGNEPAPPAPAPRATLEGLYYVQDDSTRFDDSYSRAEYFRFDADGRVFRGVPHRSGIDCARTRPNGLPYCDAYDVVDGELIVRSATGVVARYALRRDGARLVAIDERAAIPVVAVDPAALVGGWSNVSYRQIGCLGLGFCSSTLTERQLAFSADGRFFRRSTRDSATSLEGTPGSGLGSSHAFGSSDSGLVGTYAVQGNELLLSFDNGRLVREFVSRPDADTVAVGNLAYASE